ncbi:MAG: hypothetical protein A3K66_02150 [Euryarchaeota archaeon RBG_16_67_27]|nr:MAG: hypothetical protein A3K66_02150 [Euryarchaeota archaeon RBG_16_67_27]
MAQPPPAAGSAPPPTAPPGPPPPYPYPYPYYPPPRKDNTVLIVVIVIVVVVLATIITSAILYVMVSGLIGGQPTNRPVLTFGPAQASGGNVSFSIASVSQSFPFSSYKLTLQVGTVTGSAAAVLDEPSFTSITVGTTVYRVYWSDLGDENNLNDGDSFRVTGNGVVLPTGSYTFYLLWSADNAQIQTKSWLL